ncbi:Protease synthase and sporulation negative regulatory protein PAI 1 [compost metagenome]|jgi:ribosomal-protein-alanine N-acetyltransferase|uniref:[Ribosomal protein bS18]-alanine N-acetyltransferase n=1 Tax=Clostridium intestinale DSM 6191 TaxID=1121320 RepID=A0A1M6DRK4_9CLOT|nr:MULTISPECIES: ribosomal protein S18-alanine N-acetyltransferase [Clostridium]WRY49841.1 ribosomal protein S18-alanine N-acetyltransferase [Clostridium intestinale]SHI75760.1 [SSU ribosomal protein S18P]-alanine acetyltransferase [Clostridium intestinale DSM 6191]
MDEFNSKQFTIVDMTSEHLVDICEISIFSFPIPWSYDSFKRELKNKLASYLVVIMDNRVIAYGGIWVILEEAHITNIAVHPDYRCKGIGETLLNALLDKAYARGAKEITLEVRVSNLPAQWLYKKLGFSEEGIRKNYYEDNKEDALIMWKR